MEDPGAERLEGRRRLIHAFADCDFCRSSSDESASIGTFASNGSSLH